jgi:hypothetical protein
MPDQPAPDKRNLRVSHEDRDKVAEQLRVAAGDGRLTADELDERLETALTARTYGELEVLLVDLPTSPGAMPAPAAEAKDLVHLKITHGMIRRDGPWAVPRRLLVEARHGNVIIDFSVAAISQPTLELEISVGHGNVVLVVPPEVVVDVDNVTVGHGSIHQRVHRVPGTPVKLLVTASGNMRHGNLVVRGWRPHRTFWDWLLRRRPLTARELPALGSRLPELFHPAPPFVLAAVTAGHPEALAETVGVEHHGVGAGSPDRPEPVLGCLQQRRADSPASPRGADREPVEVAAPAVPAGDDRADQLSVVLSHDHRIRIAAEQGGHRLPRIGRPGGVLGRLAPQRQQAVNVSDRARAQCKRHPLILPDSQRGAAAVSAGLRPF